MARILTVDDEPDVLFLLKLTLELAGHTVEQAADGATALQMIRSCAPDLVVTDLMMPGVDGGELINRIRAMPELARLPIIALSAAPDVSVAADIVMRKPFLQQDLVAAISSLVTSAA